MQRSRNKPDWLRSPQPSGRQFTAIKSTLRDHGLHTVCEEAHCPNKGECWSGGTSVGGGGDAGGSAGANANTPTNNEARDATDQPTQATATFMLMGDRCSRGCRFCDVATGGMEPLDPDEPATVADAVADIGLAYVVLTAVDRDDLPDGGASHIAATVREIKRRDPSIRVEALIPDFQGETAAIDSVLEAGPDVVAHNVETVERLQSSVRDPRAGYTQSLSVLDRISHTPDVYAKTSLMLGVGEYTHEVYQTLRDLDAIGVDMLTLGQYLQPSPSHLDVFEYVHPDVFDTWKTVAQTEFDFLYCAAGPLVRSSHRAGERFVEAVSETGTVGRHGSGRSEVG